MSQEFDSMGSQKAETQGKTQGKVIVITGASRGIGRACALALAEKGASLALMARSVEALEAVAAECEAQGAQTLSLGLDLSEMGAIDQAMSQVIERFGRVDALVNNAGIWDERPFEQGDMEAWERALDVNLKAPIRLTRRALERMPDGGAVIFIGSTASKRAYAKGTNYCAAKRGLLAFAEALFEDCRERGVRVCSILPGVVDTDMHANDAAMDQAKMIQPEDVASAARFAISAPSRVCVSEICIQPQRAPKRR